MKTIETLRTKIDHLENARPDAAAGQITGEIRRTIDAAILENPEIRDVISEFFGGDDDEMNPTTPWMSAVDLQTLLEQLRVYIAAWKKEN